VHYHTVKMEDHVPVYEIWRGYHNPTGFCLIIPSYLPDGANSFEPGMKQRGIMDNESGEFMDGDEEPGKVRLESEVEKLVPCCRRETGS